MWHGAEFSWQSISIRRRTGARRTLEIGEVLATESKEPEINILYKWDAKSDHVKPVNKSHRVMEEIEMHTGYSLSDIKSDLKEKEKILHWLINKEIKDVESVGKVVSEYYRDKDKVLDVVKKGGDYDQI